MEVATEVRELEYVTLGDECMLVLLDIGMPPTVQRFGFRSLTYVRAIYTAVTRGVHCVANNCMNLLRERDPYIKRARPIGREEAQLELGTPLREQIDMNSVKICLKGPR